MNFLVLRSSVKELQFIGSGKYEVKNEELARTMLSHSLNRLKQEKVFGSGWKLYRRDYPHFIVEDNFIGVYDSTHIDPHSFSME